MEKIVKILKQLNKTISSMESCTGGLFASELTNIDGASDVFNLGLVTYSNEFKEYFGVAKETIEEYTVYSNQVSSQMAEKVSEISKSNYGIGITGQLGTKDLKNYSNKINTVYITIYDKDSDKFYNYNIETNKKSKLENKIFVINYIRERLYEIFK